MSIDREALARTGVYLPDDPPPPTASESMTADSLGLTVEEIRFCRRLGTDSAVYRAAKGVRNLPEFEAAREEMRRRREAGA